MANNYTQFSFKITDCTVDEVSWLVREKAKMVDTDEDYCFELTVEEGTAYFSHRYESGDVEATANFVSQFLREHRPLAVVGFEWADVCSRPKVGEFGGGAVLVTATGVKTRATCELLEELSTKAVHTDKPADGDVDANIDAVDPVEAAQFMRHVTELLYWNADDKKWDTEGEIRSGADFVSDVANALPTSVVRAVEVAAHHTSETK